MGHPSIREEVATSTSKLIDAAWSHDQEYWYYFAFCYLWVADP